MIPCGFFPRGARRGERLRILSSVCLSVRSDRRNAKKWKLRFIPIVDSKVWFLRFGTPKRKNNRTFSKWAPKWVFGAFGSQKSSNSTRFFTVFRKRPLQAQKVRKWAQNQFLRPKIEICSISTIFTFLDNFGLKNSIFGPKRSRPMFHRPAWSHF